MTLKGKVNDLHFQYHESIPRCIFVANLVILVQICDELLWGQGYGRTDRRMDISWYEQTHNIMQVWTGKLSELQLPAQCPAREGACTSMSY